MTERNSHISIFYGGNLMGITLSAIHIYSEKPVTLSQFPLYSFSEHTTATYELTL